MNLTLVSRVIVQASDWHKPTTIDFINVTSELHVLSLIELKPVVSNQFPWVQRSKDNGVTWDKDRVELRCNLPLPPFGFDCTNCNAFRFGFWSGNIAEADIVLYREHGSVWQSNEKNYAWKAAEDEVDTPIIVEARQ